MSDNNLPSRSENPEVITQVSVSEISVERTGTLPTPTEPQNGSTLSRVSLGLGVFSLLFAPVFGAGVVPAIVGIILGHIAKRADPISRLRAMIGLGLSYVALVVGTAILVLVAIPIVLAFLMSTGYILTD